MKIFINWLFYAIAIIISAYLLPGVTVSGLVAALVLAVVLGAINAFLKPIIIILTLPINILTLGLFTFIINALLIMLSATIVPGFAVDSFWSALFFGVVLSVVSWVLARFDGDPTN